MELNKWVRMKNLRTEHLEWCNGNGNAIETIEFFMRW